MAHLLDRNIVFVSGSIRSVQIVLIHLTGTFNCRNVQAELVFRNFSRVRNALAALTQVGGSVQHLVRDAVHIQRLVALVSPIVACTVTRVPLLLRFHAEAHARFYFELDHGLMAQVELVSEVLAQQLLLALFHVCKLLLFQNALQDLIAGDLVHVKNFFSYNSIDTF